MNSTKYSSVINFATVMAATCDLRNFAENLLKTPEKKWFIYLALQVGGKAQSKVKEENKPLLKQIKDLVSVAELRRIDITREFLNEELQLTKISETGKMP